MSAASRRAFKLALIQMHVGADTSANLDKASCLIRKAAEENANVVALPVGISDSPSL